MKEMKKHMEFKSKNSVWFNTLKTGVTLRIWKTSALQSITFYEWAHISITIQGNKYWRFDDAVLNEDYPRDISVGFEKIPDDIDAAFAIPAPGHHGKEKVYFFKGM